MISPDTYILGSQSVTECLFVKNLHTVFFTLRTRCESLSHLFKFIINALEFQSGFRAGHSTETALVKVVIDLLMAVDSGLGVVLIMLDLSAAFDTVDHSILLKHLECDVGIKGTALKWFHSYLHDRTFFVNFANTSSSVAPLKYGLPQGSILGPTLFSLYMCPLGSICRRYDISYHMYADDTQIYCIYHLKSRTSTRYRPYYSVWKRSKFGCQKVFFS